MKRNEPRRGRRADVLEAERREGEETDLALRTAGGWLV